MLKVWDINRKGFKQTFGIAQLHFVKKKMYDKELHLIKKLFKNVLTLNNLRLQCKNLAQGESLKCISFHKFKKKKKIYVYFQFSSSI